MNALRKESAINATLYVLNALGETDLHKLFKMLYFADREHLAKFGRSITGDEYIAMNFGPVPSQIYDAIKAAQGKSCFSSAIDEAKSYFVPKGRYGVAANRRPDMDWLSGTDVSCLDNAIAFCKGKSFEELVEASHQYAWNNTKLGTEIAVADMMREGGCPEAMVEYFVERRRFFEALSDATA